MQTNAMLKSVLLNILAEVRAGPSELVRTQGVFCAGAAQLVENILVYHIAVGHIERRQEHGKDHDPQKHDSSHCQLVPGEARCGQLPAAALQPQPLRKVSERTATLNIGTGSIDLYQEVGPEMLRTLAELLKQC